MRLLLLLALAGPAPAPPIPPPRGVNDAILGTAEESMMVGPARICFIRTGFDLRSGERSYLDYLGIHWGAFRVISAGGEFLLREGDSWATPRPGGRAIADAHGRRIVRYRTAGHIRYLIYGRVYDGQVRDAPMVSVEGAALTGTARDRAILERIVVLPENDTSCSRRYVYGLFFDEPAQ